MYRITELLVGFISYKCLNLYDIPNTTRAVFGDENGNTFTVSFRDLKGDYSKENILNFIKDTYGVTEVFGISSTRLFAFDDIDFKMLDLLDWNGYVDSRIIEFKNYDKSLVDIMSDTSHIPFRSRTEDLSIIDVLVTKQNNYKITDDTIVVKTQRRDSPTYKILDMKKFSNLLTKMIVLRGSNV